MPASLTDLFDTAFDPIAVLNHNGTISLANQGFSSVLGHAPAGLLGVKLGRMFHRADRDRAEQTITKASRTGEPMQLEGRIAHGRGGFRWTTWSLRTSPDGTLYAMGRDESIRRQIEAAVRKRERRNRAMLDHAADVLVVLDATGVICDANATAAAVLGLPRDVLLGRHLGEVIVGLDASSLGPGDGLTVETHLVTLHGDRIAVEARLEAFEFEGQLMIVVLARDIRERKAQSTALERANAALQEATNRAEGANAAKSTYVTQMSHALRTPLGAILGYVELLREDAPTELRGDIRRTHEAARHLLDLVDDIHDLSRIESGTLELISEYIELDALERQVRDTLGHEAAFETHIEAEPPTLEADRGRVLQMLLNLLSDAEAQAASSVRFHVTDEDDEHLKFTVSHDGPPRDETALEPFSDGRRLSLPIASQLAERLGGELRFDPSGRGLFVVLPRMATYG